MQSLYGASEGVTKAERQQGEEVGGKGTSLRRHCAACVAAVWLQCGGEHSRLRGSFFFPEFNFRVSISSTLSKEEFCNQLHLLFPVLVSSEKGPWMQRSCSLLQKHLLSANLGLSPG